MAESGEHGAPDRFGPARGQGEQEPRIRCWEAYLEVAALGSVTAAARSLGLSQPAVSRMIQQLEQDLGRELFRREGHCMNLTELGRSLRGEAERAVAAVYGLRDRAREYVGDGGPLHVACVTGVASGLLPEAIRRAGLDLASGLIVESDTADRCQLAVIQDRVHLAVSSSPILFGELSCHWLIDAPCVAALPENTPLAAHDGPISLGELLSLPLIATTRTRGTAERIRQETLKVSPAHVARLQTNSIVNALAMVRRGLGASIIDPISAAAACLAGVRTRPLSVDIPHCIGLVAMRGRALSANAAALTDALRSTALLVVRGSREIEPEQHRSYLAAMSRLERNPQ